MMGVPNWWAQPTLRLRITGKLRFARATHRGVQRGKAPLRFFPSPKIEDPPQEEWGIKGVENRLRDDAGVHSPPCRLSVVKTTGS